MRDSALASALLSSSSRVDWRFSHAAPLVPTVCFYDVSGCAAAKAVMNNFIHRKTVEVQYQQTAVQQQTAIHKEKQA